MSNPKRAETGAAYRALLNGQMTEQGLMVSGTALSYLRAGGLSRRKDYTWESWDDTRLKPFPIGGVLRSHAEFGFRWLGNLPQVRPWLVFVGSTGVGKSHLATLLAKMWVVVNEQAARIINWPMWLEALKHSYNNGHEVSVLQLTSVPFLVLDDLTYESTQHSLKMLYLTLEGRAEKPTIITTNIRLGEYRDTLHSNKRCTYAAAIASRLSTGAGSSVRGELLFTSSKGDYRVTKR